jgi:hypothetical protein
LALNDVDDDFRRTRVPTLISAHRQEHTEMMDVVMLAIGLVFFVLSVGYCYACDRL